MAYGNFPASLLVAELVPNALDGRKQMYIYSPVADCCLNTAAVEAFDSTFSPKESNCRAKRNFISTVILP